MKKLAILIILAAFFLSGCSDSMENIAIKVKCKTNGMSTSVHIVFCYDKDTYNELKEILSFDYFKRCGELYSEHCENIDIFNIEPYEEHKTLRYKLINKKRKRVAGVLIFSKHTNKQPVRVTSSQYQNSIITLKKNDLQIKPVEKINNIKKEKLPIKHNSILYQYYQSSINEGHKKLDEYQERLKNDFDKMQSDTKNEIEGKIMEKGDFIEKNISEKKSKLSQQAKTKLNSGKESVKNEIKNLTSSFL